MKPVSKTTITKYAKKLNESNTDSFILAVDEDDYEVTVKKKLNISELILFVNEVANGVISESVYMPYNYQYSYGCALIKYFTNIPMPDIQEEDVLTDKNINFNLISKTDIVRKIEKIIGEEEIEKLNSEIWQLIEFRKQQLIINEQSINKLSDNLSNMVSGLVSMLSGLKDKFDKIDIDHLDEFSENLADLFGNKINNDE